MTFLAIVGGIALLSAFYWYSEWSEERETEKEIEAIMQKPKQNIPKVNEQPMEKPATRDLVKQVLRKMGCRVEDTDEQTITFEYQAVTFVMEVVNDCLFVNLIWPWCHSCNIFDIDEFARVRKVINEINSRSSCTIFYIKCSESDDVAVHIRKNFIFVPQIQHLEEYLQSILSSFFAAARELNLQIEKVRMQECENNP